MGLRSRKVRLDEIGRRGRGGSGVCLYALNLRELLWMYRYLYLDWGVWHNSVRCKRYLGSKARANICSAHVQTAQAAAQLLSDRF